MTRPSSAHARPARSIATLLLAILAALVAPTLSRTIAGQTPGTATFTRDIAPILQRSCQNCHRPNSVAPMSLISYEDVRPWAKSIKARTGLGTRMGVMPPWFIDKHVGIEQYKDDISLSEREIAAIADWADKGAPRGNDADMPPARCIARSRRAHISRSPSNRCCSASSSFSSTAASSINSHAGATSRGSVGTSLRA